MIPSNSQRALSLDTLTVLPSVPLTVTTSDTVTIIVTGITRLSKSITGIIKTLLSNSETTSRGIPTASPDTTTPLDSTTGLFLISFLIHHLRHSLISSPLDTPTIEQLSSDTLTA